MIWPPPGGAAYSGHKIAGWVAFNITSDPKAGIGSWSQQQLEEYLRTGHVNGKAQAAGPMADIIMNITGAYSEQDRAALANIYIQFRQPILVAKLKVARAGEHQQLTSTAFAV